MTLLWYEYCIHDQITIIILSWSSSILCYHICTIFSFLFRSGFFPRRPSRWWNFGATQQSFLSSRMWQWTLPSLFITCTASRTCWALFVQRTWFSMWSNITLNSRELSKGTGKLSECQCSEQGKGEQAKRTQRLSSKITFTR